MLGGAAIYQRKVAEAQTAYDSAVQSRAKRENQRLVALGQARLGWEEASKREFDLIEKHNQEIDELERMYTAGDPAAIVGLNTALLERSSYPSGFPQRFRVAYVLEPKQLVVEYELPTATLIPTVAEFRYVKARYQTIGMDLSPVLRQTVKLKIQ